MRTIIEHTVIIVAVMCVLSLAPAQAQNNDLPQPPVITALPGEAPSDAVVLFDGSSLEEWTFTDKSAPDWPVADGAFSVVSGKGGIVTKERFGNFQLHLEFKTPTPPVGDGQGRGNSGVYLHGAYEVQVLDSFENETYADGMASSVYAQHAPTVNPSRPPGEWQTYDIIFHAAEFNTYGERAYKARVTVIYNGVVVQDNVYIDGSTPGALNGDESEYGPIFIQDHSNPVQYRNIWVRKLK
jgi:hypothetical protein